MRFDSEKNYAVVTGDIVGSSRFEGDRRRKLHEAMGKAGKNLLMAFEKDISLDIDIFRGDSWQCLIDTPSICLRAAFLYRAMLKAFMDDGKTDTRLAISLGKVDFFPEKRVSEGDGEAYRLSGRLLEKMSGPCLVAFGIHGKQDVVETRAISVVACFMDFLARGWTGKQAMAICGALRGMSQIETAESWSPRPISQQAVAQHLERAGWHVMRKGIEFAEEMLESYNSYKH